MSKKSKDEASHIESPEELARQREQEAIVVPKGQSRLKSFMIWGLMIFVLFIFSVGGAFQDTFSCNGQTTTTHLTWKGIDGGTRVLDYRGFLAKKQEYSRLRDLYSHYVLGMPDMKVNEDAHVARLIVMVDIARGAGVRVTNADLNDAISAMFGPTPNYRRWVDRQRGLSVAGFETTLRDVLVVQRFRRLLALGTGSVDHDELVTRWQATRTEYSFDYVEARTSDFEPEVQDDLPDTQALNSWLLALSENEQRRFHSPERWNAEFAVLPVPVEGDAGELLLAAYPRPEDEDAILKARDYYSGFIGTRFRRPEETASEDDEASGDDEAAGDDATSDEDGATEDAEPEPDTPFFSFDEVEALCLTEAPLYYSLADWHLDIQQRVAGGEEVELAAECERLGLTFISEETVRTLEEWNELDAEWAGENLGNSLRFTQAGRFTASLRVHPGGVIASRVSERLPPALPDFLEIEADVAAAWIKDAAAIRAKFTLEGIRDRVGHRAPGEPIATTPEQFATAASNSGAHAQKDFTVQHRAFQERYIPPKPGEETPAIQTFLRFNPQLFNLEEGIVWEAKPSTDSESVFLVLVGPTRPASVSKMQPQDLAVQRAQMASNSIQSFFASTFDFASPESMRFLEREFDYYLETGEDDGGSSGG